MLKSKNKSLKFYLNCVLSESHKHQITHTYIFTHKHNIEYHNNIMETNFVNIPVIVIMFIMRL